jgi:hypothetical protein
VRAGNAIAVNLGRAVKQLEAHADMASAELVSGRTTYLRPAPW